MMRWLLVVAVASGCGEPPGQSTSIPDDLDAAEPLATWEEERTLFLPTSTLIEAQVTMEPGDAFDMDFTSMGGPVAWNIHSHDSDFPTNHAQGRSEHGTFTFVAPAAGRFLPLWVNDQAATLRVVVRLRGHGSSVFNGWL
ncbi:MAG TPA: hypothetical protein VK698_00460 [Kofleriaceae bacterium]|nr:hypothetical protein [Kofleriaceae bacterium]